MSSKWTDATNNKETNHATIKTKEVHVFQSQALICSPRPWKVSRQRHSLAALTLESWSTQVCSATAALMQSSLPFHLCIQLGFNAPFSTSLSIELMDHGSESQPHRKQMSEREGERGDPKGECAFTELGFQASVSTCLSSFKPSDLIQFCQISSSVLPSLSSLFLLYLPNVPVLCQTRTVSNFDLLTLCLIFIHL